MMLRSSLVTGGLLAMALAGVLLAEDAPPTAPTSASVSCELAYTEVVSFDYDRDGTRDRVQFWLVIQGRPASGDPGTPGAEPESGSVRYYVYDVDRKQRVDDWLMGFNMGFPVAGEPYPVTDIDIDGRTARFDIRGARWTVTDGGDTWEKDTIEIESGGRRHAGRFYGGDARVTPDPSVVSEPVDIEENRKCIGCHREAALTMAAEGGPHRELECAFCHAEHPPEAEGALPQCLECHDAHDASMSLASCTTCHSSHAVKTLRYGITVPDAYCTVCHEEAAARLRASRTRHIGLACALCHRSEHEAVPACLDCHGGPHPKDVMAEPDLCARCHHSAHETRRGR